MRLLLVHGDLAAGGGAEAYAAAVAETLGRIGHSPEILDIRGLRDGSAQRDWPILRLGRMPLLRRFHLLKYALVCRLLPRLASDYDRVVLTYGEGPELPVPALTVHHAPALFSTDRADLEALGAAGRGRFHLLLRALYTRLMRRIARVRRPHRAAVVVANSRWTAARVSPPPGQIAVVHPPVSPPAPAARACSRSRSRSRIVMLGRMSRNKRIEEGIAIVERLRAEGLPAELDVIGRAADRHASRLMRRHAARGGWLRFHPDASAQTVAALLAGARFGLHCYRQEHFGIAVAEMICAGVIPMVYAGGGVCELVPLAQLQFHTPDEAVARLAALMMSGEDELEGLSRRLQEGPALRGALEFETRLAPVLAQFLEAGE